MLSDTMYNIHTRIQHLYIVSMHILCKYFFVRIIVDLFAGPFNCLNFSLEVCVWGGGGGGGGGAVRACMCWCLRVCVRACVFVSLSLSYIFPIQFIFVMFMNSFC